MHLVKLNIADTFEGDSSTTNTHDCNENNVSVISVVSHSSSHPSPYQQNSTTDKPKDKQPTSQCISDEDICNDFVRHTCGCKKAG